MMPSGNFLKDHSHAARHLLRKRACIEQCNLADERMIKACSGG